MSRIVIHPESGMTGSLFIGLMLGFGAEPEKLQTVPELLGFENSSTEAHIQKVGLAESFVLPKARTRNSCASRRWHDLRATIACADINSAVCSDAMRCLILREHAMAQAKGCQVDSAIFQDEDIEDTLIDLLGAMILWHDIGCPVIVVNDTINLGQTAHAATKLLLSKKYETACSGGSDDLAFTSPTGAAILRTVRAIQDHRDTIKDADYVVQTGGDYTVASKCAPLRAGFYR